MLNAPLAAIVKHCDRLLRTQEIGDYEGAFNGLQVENTGVVTRIAAAVDASLATVKLAVAAQADLLIVHHGLFWSPRQPWTGKNYELLRLLIENNVAVYSSHLPLDLHPQLGNNAQLGTALGLLFAGAPENFPVATGREARASNGREAETHYRRPGNVRTYRHRHRRRRGGIETCGSGGRGHIHHW